MINLADHVIDLRGKAYLPVAPRIAYFRDQHDDWAIVTDVIIDDGAPRLVRATIIDADGRIRATAHKTVTAFEGGSVEKAETGAIGRALSLVGVGTLLALDMDEGEEIADAPQAKPAKGKADGPAPTAAELAALDALGVDDLRAAYKAAQSANRQRFADAIAERASALKTKTAA